MIQTSKIFELPAELRNEIYRQVLTSPSELRLDCEDIPNRTSLLQTCQQIRSEGISIFYAEDHFKATVPKDTHLLLSWLESLDPQQTTQRLQNLQLDWETSERNKYRLREHLRDKDVVRREQALCELKSWQRDVQRRTAERVVASLLDLGIPSGAIVTSRLRTDSMDLSSTQQEPTEETFLAELKANWQRVLWQQVSARVE